MRTFAAHYCAELIEADRVVAKHNGPSRGAKGARCFRQRPLREKQATMLKRVSQRLRKSNGLARVISMIR